jgi:anti-sigma factor RsiW
MKLVRGEPAESERTMNRDCQKATSLIERYFDGELSNRQSAFVEDHLVDCPECAAELESLQRLRGALQVSIREAANHADFARIWQAVEPRLEGPRPSLWERWTVALREYLSVYKPVWATAASAAVVALLVAVPLLVQKEPAVQIQKPQSNECIIESIESSGSTAMIYEVDQDQTKVIWMFEDADDSGEGPSTL